MRICSCSHDKAIEILEELEFLAQKDGYEVLKSNNDLYIPMVIFLKYIGPNRVNRIERYHNSLIEFGY